MIAKTENVAYVCFRFYLFRLFIVVFYYFVVYFFSFRSGKTELFHVYAQTLELCLQCREVKVCVHGQLVVHQCVCAPLFIREVVEPYDRHALDSELFCGDQPAVPFDDLVSVPYCDRIIEAELLYASLDLLDLLRRVNLGVSCIRHKVCRLDVFNF